MSLVEISIIDRKTGRVIVHIVVPLYAIVAVVAALTVFFAMRFIGAVRP